MRFWMVDKDERPVWAPQKNPHCAGPPTLANAPHRLISCPLPERTFVKLTSRKLTLCHTLEMEPGCQQFNPSSNDS